ncbi:MAG: sulfatase [Candidatus Altiarchaeota archaeon]
MVNRKAVFVLLVVCFGCLTDDKIGEVAVTQPEMVKVTDDFSGSNVILISIDTLRGDRLGSYGYPINNSPTIDELAKDSVIFYNVLSASGMTEPSHKSMLTGKLVATHKNDLSGSKTLAEVFKENGYATAAFTDGGKVHPVFGFGKGFDLYEVRDMKRVFTGFEDESFDHWIHDNAGNPFFIFLHYYHIHCPYTSPEPYRSQYTAYYTDRETVDLLEKWCPSSRKKTVEYQDTILESKNMISDLYDAQIPAFDELVFKKIIDTVKSAGVYNNTIIMVTSDHGEFLGENDIFGHGRLGWPGLKIPWIIHLPDNRASRFNFPASGIDLTPTLLDLVNLSIPDDVDGISLKPLILFGEKPERYLRIANSNNGERFFCDRAMKKAIIIPRPKDDKYKILARDKTYTDDEEAPFVLQCLNETLAIRSRDKGVPLSPSTTLRITKELRKQLRDLGYLD